MKYSLTVYMFSGFGDTAATATLDTTTNPATFSWPFELGVSPSQNPYNPNNTTGVALVEVYDLN